MKPARPRPIKVKKTWTHDQAWAAQKKFRNNGGAFADPAGPFDQWVALSMLDSMKIAFEGGDSFTLMRAIRLCANHDLVMPDWVRRGFILAFDKVNGYRAKSWDEVFGKPLPKGANLNALRKKREKSILVWNEVHRRLHTNKIWDKSSKTWKPLVPIDDELFTEVGQQFGLGLTLTKEYYAHAKKRINRLPSNAKKATPRTLKK